MIVCMTTAGLTAANFPNVQDAPRQHTSEYTFRVWDETSNNWLPGVEVDLTVLDGSSPPQSDITDNHGGVTFALSSPPGTPIQLQLTKTGYCAVTVTLLLPEKRGKGLAPQIPMAQCAPAALVSR